MHIDLTKPFQSNFELDGGHRVSIATTARDTEVRDDTSGRTAWLPRIGKLDRGHVERALARHSATETFQASPAVIDRIWSLVDWLQTNSK